MKKYVCDICGYVYDPAKGDPDNDIEPGTAFEDLPEDWVCPECGASKSEFVRIEHEQDDFAAFDEEFDLVYDEFVD